MTAKGVRRMIEIEIARFDNTAMGLARHWGISSAYLCDVRKGRREPGESILKHLWLRKDVRYLPMIAKRPR